MGAGSPVLVSVVSMASVVLELSAVVPVLSVEVPEPPAVVSALSAEEAASSLGPELFVASVSLELELSEQFSRSSR